MNDLTDTQHLEEEQPKYRIPPEHKGIQINYCKNPECENYGIPAELTGKHKKSDTDKYKIVASGKGQTFLHCKSCGEFIPVKSNIGIVEELERMSTVFQSNTIQCCPDESCSNHQVPITTPKAYQSFGKTKSGSDRYRCKVCKKTFAVGSSTRYQKQPEINEQVFKLLMNRSPLRRICEITGINFVTLYHRIDFLEEQCKKFSAFQDEKLKTLPIKRLYLSVDGQSYLVNWTQRKDKRNNVFQGFAIADNETRYVFANHLNYDENLIPEEIEHNASLIEEVNKPAPFRRYARLWLTHDYNKSIQKTAKLNGSMNLEGDIQHTYDEQEKRDDVEKLESLDTSMQLPKAGMQVHAEYTLYGQFHYLKNLLGNVEKFRFFLDQDAGVRAACLSAFKEEIKERKCDAFYVRISKELTVDEKRKCKANAKKEFDKIKKENEFLEDYEVKLMMIKDRIKHMREIGKWKDKWLSHPLPDMSEPEKAVCYLTDFKDYEPDHLAWLYNKASLHAVDNYFMLIRRRIAMLERPMHSSANAGRVWNGYGAYNPAMVGKLLTIFRTFYNYMLVGSDGKTPAMRLGVMDRVVGYEELIGFKV